MFIIGTIGIALVVIGATVLMSDEKPKKRNHRKCSVDPPGWGTPHGF